MEVGTNGFRCVALIRSSQRRLLPTTDTPDIVTLSLYDNDLTLYRRLALTLVQLMMGSALIEVSYRLNSTLASGNWTHRTYGVSAAGVTWPSGERNLLLFMFWTGYGLKTVQTHLTTTRADCHFMTGQVAASGGCLYVCVRLHPAVTGV